MHWTEFLLALTGKLVWPTAIIVMLVILRKPLALLIPKATRVKIKDMEFEFGKALEEVEEKAEQAFPERKESRRSLILSTAASMPNAAVLDAWKAVDDTAEALLRKVVPTLNLRVNERYKLMENTLLEHGLMDVKKGKLFGDLRQLRNKVAHATRYQVGQTEASRYVDLCFILIEYLQQVGANLEGRDSRSE